MTIGEILIWEATNVLLLILVVIALVILTRWIRRLPLFTDRDWLFLTGRQSSLGSLMAQIPDALVRRCGHRLC
jgi:hypothetical protein